MLMTVNLDLLRFKRENMIGLSILEIRKSLLLLKSGNSFKVIVHLMTKKINLKT